MEKFCVGLEIVLTKCKLLIMSLTPAHILYSDNYTNYTVARHSGTNPKSIRHYDRYGIRP